MYLGLYPAVGLFLVRRRKRFDRTPALVQHGTADTVIPVQCSINLAARLAQVTVGDTVQLELIEGADHLDPLFETEENVQTVLDFLDKHLKRT